MSQAIADKMENKIIQFRCRRSSVKQSWAMTSPWCVTDAAVRLKSLSMQQLYHILRFCLSGHGSLSLIPAARSKWLSMGTTVATSTVQCWYTETHGKEKSNIPHISLPLLFFPITSNQPAPQRPQSLALPSSSPRPAAVPHFWEPRQHKMTHMLAVLLLPSYWQDWIHKAETPFTALCVT